MKEAEAEAEAIEPSTEDRLLLESLSKRPGGTLVILCVVLGRTMVSRKKAKGKARKAAKAKAEEEYAMFKPFSLTQFKKSSCTHGWNHDAYASSHDCYNFVEAVMEAFRRNTGKFDIFDAPKEATLHKYPEIWGDPTKFEWVASAFVSIGVEVLIRQDDKVGKLILSVYSIAYSEWIHQHVACALHKSVPTMYMARLNDLMHADQRRKSAKQLIGRVIEKPVKSGASGRLLKMQSRHDYIRILLFVMNIL
eukprot:scaffold4261_cov192-Skeletonema_marinoi.AAC.2